LIAQKPDLYLLKRVKLWLLRRLLNCFNDSIA
jgi:hypothetical protein